KGLSLSVHVRRAEAPVEALAVARACAESFPGARLIDGKAVLNVTPAEANKGLAVGRELLGSRCATAIVVGDDVTDEDAFALGGVAGWLTVRVGGDVESAATYYLRDQPEIDA